MAYFVALGQQLTAIGAPQPTQRVVAGGENETATRRVLRLFDCRAVRYDTRCT